MRQGERSTGGSRLALTLIVAGAAAALGLWAFAAPSAHAAVPHLVQPGESLWSIASANNFTTTSVAAYNGIAADAQLVAGETIQIPTEAEAAAAVAAAGPTTTTEETTTTETAAPDLGAPPVPAPGETYGLGHIPSPWGELHLDPAAAASWNSMREASLATYGVDLYPAGPLSAYRTYAQQDYLYRLYLAGEGAPANPAGSSTHELGIAVDVATHEMRSIVDAIGASYGWSGTIPSEWWHVAYTG